jgi:porphobilinogen synthase
MFFPRSRMRRLRIHPAVRELVEETHWAPHDLIWPLFVCRGEGVAEPIASLPGVFHLSVDRLLDEVREAKELGVRAVLLFGLPSEKDERGSEAYDPDGTVQQAVRALKEAHPDVAVFTDVCLCAYTSHGHCGVLNGSHVDNDATLKVLAQVALSHAKAGADFVAPSDMMDGRVDAIRRRLDEENFKNVGIMSYAAKYASAFYGPFRDAAHSAPQFGDRRSYQMNPANAREAVSEIEKDVREGADIVMVKPALPCLDVIRAARERFHVPIAAYNVSGEYAMLKAAAANGWLDEQKTMFEMLTCIKRAGADILITYFAKDAARALHEDAG